jgi:hypothetical protein
MRDSHTVLLAALLVVALAFGRGSAQQQLPAPADSLTEGSGRAADVSQELQHVIVDSLSERVMVKLVERINPVVTPNNTRLTLVPTARSLKPGAGYVENMSIFLWSMGYGISDRHAVLGGMSMLPFLKLDDQLFYFGTKSSIHRSESAQIAAGLISVNQKALDEPLSALFGVVTFGGTDAALSILVAYGFEGTEMADQPVVILGGERRMGRRTFFVGELAFYDETPAFPLLGIKRYSEDGGAHWGYTFPYFLYYSFGFGGD